MDKKRVLIITYYWPPAGGPGVQRWLKFIKYLPDFNIEPIVYIPENPNYPIIDESLVNEIPKGVTILKQPIAEPYKLANKFSRGKSKNISKGIIPDKKKQFCEILFDETICLPFFYKMQNLLGYGNGHNSYRNMLWCVLHLSSSYHSNLVRN